MIERDYKLTRAIDRMSSNTLTGDIPGVWRDMLLFRYTIFYPDQINVKPEAQSLRINVLVLINYHCAHINGLIQVEKPTS